MTAVAESPSALETRYVDVPLAQLVSSKTNPRTHFDDAYLAELAGSIREKGVIQPIIIRPNGGVGRFEIVAGECRWRAAKKAGLSVMPALVRPYTDEQALEVQLIENIHRTDLTPLEQAVGYRKLIDSNPTKHSAATIAQRIGMSEAWVWDRLKLNDLIPACKAILEQARITIGHAILLARLKPADQARAIAYDDAASTQFRCAGLWRHDAGFDYDDQAKKRDPYYGLKACSVRELDAWIRDHVRFDVAHAAKAQPFTFETTAAEVARATAEPGRGKKVVAITTSYRVADDARADERTYGAQAWKRADGKEKSKPCEHSVLGVIVAGDGYGETFDVCVARDACRVHWDDVIRQKEKAAKERASGQTAKADRREQAAERKQAREQAEREQKAARWKTFYPALRKAVLTAVGGLKTVNGPLYEKALKANGLPASTKPAHLPRVLLQTAVASKFHSYAGEWNEAEFVAWAKLLKIDVKALEPKAEPPAKAGRR